MSGQAAASAEAQSAVFMRSEPVPEHTKQATGPDFDHLNPIDLGALMDSMATIGFPGTSVSDAVRIIERMRTWRLSDDPSYDSTGDDCANLPANDPAHPSKVRCTIMLVYTSIIKTSGLRI